MKEQNFWAHESGLSREGREALRQARITRADNKVCLWLMIMMILFLGGLIIMVHHHWVGAMVLGLCFWAIERFAHWLQAYQKAINKSRF
jgi:hypothetical protein